MVLQAPCQACGRLFDPAVLAAATAHAFWRRPGGACPACVQQTLLTELLTGGEKFFARSVQDVWPLDAEAAFGALPIPLRLRADPRFNGRGVTIAIADSGFTPHPDLSQPTNRIAAWVDASQSPQTVIRFGPEQQPHWPGATEARDHQWHGTMTSVVAAGNGYRSNGLYRSLAPDARVVLLSLTDADGRITDQSILRALNWVETNAAEFGIRVLSLSVAADQPSIPMLGPIERSVERLHDLGITVVAAAGNDGERRLVPPATAPTAITVGGLDDRNTIDADAATIWHSNFGHSATGIPKPELVAPSLWVAAPILVGSALAKEAGELFARRAHDPSVEARLRDLKLVTPHYQHVDGTSFAAPIVAATVAALLEANSRLTPPLIKELLVRTASPVAGVGPERQGAGALNAGRATALALVEEHRWSERAPVTPIITVAGPVFQIHDHSAKQVDVFGSWDDWDAPVPGRIVEPGLWTTRPVSLGAGEYQYKFKTDGQTWVADPTNPWRAGDGVGGLNSWFTWPA